MLSDGIDFPLYLALAQGIAPAARSLGWRVVLRPHPLERTAVAAQYGERVGDVAIDRAGELYASLAAAHAVVSEVSTGLFEAVGVALDEVFLWDTAKSRLRRPTTSLSQLRER